MILFIQRIIDGIATGAMYGVVAIPMVLIFKATTLINFAQGELAMIGAFFCFVFAVQAFSLPVWIAAIIAMVLAAGLGMFIERSLLRSFDPTDHLPVVLITLGIFYVVNAMAGDIWNYQPQIDVPRLLPWTGTWVLFASESNPRGLRLQQQDVAIFFALAIMLGILFIILNKTKMGLAFRAVSSNTESSRLVGIRVGRILSFGWALACAFGALGAILVAPKITLQPIMMAPVLIFALAAAAFGGLDSVGGAAIGGVVVGLINSLLMQGYLPESSEALRTLTAVPLLGPFLVLITVLWFKPTGLFGTKTVERV
jgi:branched-chain amino acid transport system permease protein